MTIAEFRRSIDFNKPSDELTEYLNALWYDAKGDWDKAHQIIQDINDANGAWIHAYLHRKEGDIFNADYWYNRAGKKRPSYSLDKEWENLVLFFLDRR